MKCPSDSAALYVVGTRKKGKDGTDYMVRLTRDGVKKWFKVQQTPERRSSTDAMASVLPPPTEPGQVVTARLWVVIDDLFYDDYSPPALRTPSPVPRGLKSLILRGMNNGYFAFRRLVRSYAIEKRWTEFMFFDKRKVVQYPVKLLSWSAASVSDGKNPYIFVDFKWFVKSAPSVNVQDFKNEIRRQALRANAGWGQEMLERARFGPKTVPEFTPQGILVSYRVAKPGEEYYSAPPPATSSSGRHNKTVASTTARNRSSSDARHRSRALRKKLTHQHNGRYALLFTLKNSTIQLSSV